KKEPAAEQQLIAESLAGIAAAIPAATLVAPQPEIQPTGEAKTADPVEAAGGKKSNRSTTAAPSVQPVAIKAGEAATASQPSAQTAATDPADQAPLAAQPAKGRAAVAAKPSGTESDKQPAPAQAIASDAAQQTSGATNDPVLPTIADQSSVPVAEK